MARVRNRANLAVVAARASASASPARVSNEPVSRNLALRSAPVAGAASPVRRTKARMTGAQRSASGPRSLWNNSPYYKNAVTIDVRWSA